MHRPVQVGRKERMTFSKIKQVGEMPNLIDVQTKSYKWFIEEGLREVFEDFSPIRDYSNSILTMEFLDYKVNEEFKYDEEECKERDVTYAASLMVNVRLINNITGLIKEEEVFMGEFPKMTDKGTFVYNGAERVIVTQLVRSPGAYYSESKDKMGQTLYYSQIIPNRGAWIECEMESTGSIAVRIDRTRKLPLTTFLRALGLAEDEQILEVFGDEPLIKETLTKDVSNSFESGIRELYRKIKPTEPPHIENAKATIHAMFFEEKRYDVAKVGRYKYNKKLGLAERLPGCVLAEDAVDPMSGDVIASEGTLVTRQMAQDIENAGISVIHVLSKLDDTTKVRVIGNNFVELQSFVAFDVKGNRLPETVYFPKLKELLEEGLEGEALIEAINNNRDELHPKHIIVDDIIASVSYLINLNYGIGSVDDIDHFANRRLRTVGELLQNQFRIGLSRMEKIIKERMTNGEADAATPSNLINIKPVTGAIKEFFGSSQLSQFMDQNNPLAELTHKRRLSALGPGGLSRERAGFEVRDVQHSHYGRMCPIETPEGPNIGLIGSLSTYGIVDEYGFIQTPYRIVDKENARVTDEVRYFSADEEEHLIIAQANEPLDAEGHFINEKVACRGDGGEIAMFPKDVVDCMDVSPKQVVSVATAMIPFLENDDANRALMGSNMQRQAVPLLVTEAPIVGTGMEFQAARDSGAVVLAKAAGTVEFVDAKEIHVRRDEDNELDVYKLLKFKRSNQGTCINQKPIVSQGERVDKGETIADGPSTDLGEIALGKNLLVGFMTWEGYNYEDAIILNEKILVDDVLTSLHITEYELESRDTKLGPEEITRDIPNVSGKKLSNLDEDGIIRIGAEVGPMDILVGKVTPKGESDLTPEESLANSIFGVKGKGVRDASLKVPHGEKGIVVDVKRYSRENKDELPPGVNKLIRVYVATKRKINVGDKMAGRHGNKGVISRILPEEDMPFMDNGQSLQVMLNPLGVPSRMNVGQVLEVHLGLAAKAKDWYIATPVFDGVTEADIIELLKECGYSETGKLWLRDGRTGEYFDHPVTVGYMYMLKLHHLVDDKIHARSIGPYSLVTQQPLGGKAQFGGQRFGEMEVWALEAYGAAYTLQEILTVKSDDMSGRNQTYDAIVHGRNIPSPGIPESFKVLIKEMQSLGLDVSVFSDEDGEMPLSEIGEAETVVPSLESIIKEATRLEQEALEAQRAQEEEENLSETGNEVDDKEFHVSIEEVDEDGITFVDADDAE